jgi:hypothetical protein
LIESDLSFAICIKSDFSNANLKKAKIENADFRKSKLVGAKLNEAVLQRTNLSEADLSTADLSRAKLQAAFLIKTDLTEAIITGAELSGAVCENWIIEGINCEYVFFDFEAENRIPRGRDFRPKEFEELYKQLPTIEYFFEHGFTPIDAFLMDQIVQAINERNPKFELKLDSLHSRGQPHAIFTVLHQESAEEALKQIKADYEDRIKIFEAERNTIERCFMKVIEKPRTYIEYSEMIEMGDKYDIKGQTGAVGPGAHAHDLNFNQLWNQYPSEIDLKQLAGELSNLRDSLIQKADEPEHYRAIAEVSEAEAASQANDGSKALEHLKKAGKWAFSVAENIGTTIAAEALKKAMGL